MSTQTDPVYLDQLQLQSELQRMTDLVRYQRAELHQAGLLNDDEYMRLCGIKGSRERLESYDQLRSENDALKSKQGTKSAEIDNSVLVKAVKDWMDKHKPSSEESFYQNDSVNEALPELGIAVFNAGLSRDDELASLKGVVKAAFTLLNGPILTQSHGQRLREEWQLALSAHAAKYKLE